MSETRINQAHIVFRFLKAAEFTVPERLVGAAAILMTYPKGDGFTTRKSRVDKLCELTTLPQAEVSAALNALAAAGWLAFFENPDGSWGYRIPEQRLEETRAKRQAYLEEVRARPKVTVHGDGTVEVVIRPEEAGHG